MRMASPTINVSGQPYIVPPSHLPLILGMKEKSRQTHVLIWTQRVAATGAK